MVRTNKTPSVSSDTQDRLKTRKSKIQDGGLRDASGTSNSSKQTSPLVRGRHSPLNTSGPPMLPEIPSASSSPRNNHHSIKEGAEPVDLECALISCRKVVKDSDNAVCCNKCSRWLHQSCAGFNQTEYKLLNKKNKNQVNLMWFCDGCTPQVRCFLQGRSQPPQSPSAMNGDLSKKIDKLVEGFARLEQAMVSKESNMEDLIEEKVEKYFVEQREREERQSNLIFHNIPESTDEDVNDRKEHDVTLVKEIFMTLEMDYTDISKPTRLGKKMTTGKGPGKPRLLRVTVDNVNAKKQALAKAKQLKTDRNKKWNKVFITPDLTFKERTESRKLRAELATRRENGENDLVIRRGRIIKEDHTSFRGGPPGVRRESASAPTAET